MSRTACCFFALGFSVALAAACGDDSGGGGTGGSGGKAGAGGSAGAAGSSGSAGSAGTEAGAGGDGASGGVGGSGTGGGGGTTAGTAGAGGSTVVETDAGVDGSVADASPDSGGGGTAPVDSGVNGNCATLNTTNVNNGADNSQSGAIAQVIFRAGNTADVVIEATDPGGFPLGGVFLCKGTVGDGSDTTCQDLSGDAGSPTIAQFQTVTITGVTGVSVTGGELALTNDGDTAGGGFPAQVFAYIAWGTFPTGDADPLETTADGLFWTLDDRISTSGGQNAIIANPAVSDAGASSLAVASSFAACTGDDF